MVTFEDAMARVAAHVRPVGVEQVSTKAAFGRTLAKDALAEIASPRSDTSAMDGFAVNDRDLAALPARLPVALRVFAGDTPPPPLPPGRCARVFTGSSLPLGTSRVVMQEHVSRDGDIAIFSRAPAGRTHIRRYGCDCDVGTVLARRADIVSARALVTLAGGDLASVTVYRRPRVALISTGDELVPPGEARSRPGSVPNSVSLGLTAFFRTWGSEVVASACLADKLPEMVAHAETMLASADLVVVTGGASVGERDFAKAMFEPHGLQLIFDKVAIKPGKPVWLGHVGTKFILGLPGNPTSALVTARLFASPLIAGLVGRATTHDWRSRLLHTPLDKGGEREQFILASEVDGRAVPLADQESGGQRALALADLLIRRLPECLATPQGMPVETLRF